MAFMTIGWEDTIECRIITKIHDESEVWLNDLLSEIKDDEELCVEEIPDYEDAENYIEVSDRELYDTIKTIYSKVIMDYEELRIGKLASIGMQESDF